MTSPGLAPHAILNALNDGVYACDLDRRIVYWSPGAERITGWKSEDVVGHRCHDNILAHTDKDGRRLCGREHCPLHRAMVTGCASIEPEVVYGRGRDGRRIPMQMSVAPMRDERGRIVGGVESFREMSAVVAELERVKRVQSLSLETDPPADPRIGFATTYAPHGIVGGDYLAIRRLDGDRFGFLLADVMGHGASAALHTMHLSALWDRHHALLARDPSAFASALNTDLSRAVQGESFASATCGRIDLATNTLTLSSAGGPPVLIFRRDGSYGRLEPPGLPLGVLDEAEYENTGIPLRPGDTLLLFTDGAVEIHDAGGEMLGVEGLLTLLSDLGYPACGPLPVKRLEEQLLRHSNSLRLLDDLTFLEARLAAG